MNFIIYGFKLVGEAKTECHFGSWTGQTPICQVYHCEDVEFNVTTFVADIYTIEVDQLYNWTTFVCVFYIIL